jgi:hypothetical protein
VEIGVPVSCKTKASLFKITGYPKLKCDQETGEYPAEHCAMISGKKFCWDIDEFGDRISAGNFVDYENTDKEEKYELNENQFMTEWYNQSTPYSYTQNDIYYSYENAYFDYEFFNEISCKPVKMIIANALDDNSEICISPGEYWGYSLSASFDIYQYADYYCSKQGPANDCKDVKIRFICEEINQEIITDTEIDQVPSPTRDYTTGYSYYDYMNYENATTSEGIKKFDDSVFFMSNCSLIT